jgi:hypothetical protein
MASTLAGEKTIATQDHTQRLSAAQEGAFPGGQDVRTGISVGWRHQHVVICTRHT